MQSAELRIGKRERELMNVWNSLKNQGNSPISIRGSPESSLVRGDTFPGSGPVRLEEGGGLARIAWNWEFFQFRNVLPQGSQYCFPVPKRASVLLREILGLSVREIPWQLGSKSVVVFVACDQVTALSSQWLVLFRGLATIGI